MLRAATLSSPFHGGRGPARVLDLVSPGREAERCSVAPCSVALSPEPGTQAACQGTRRQGAGEGPRGGVEAARLPAPWCWGGRGQSSEERGWAGLGTPSTLRTPSPAPQTSEPGPQIIFFPRMRCSHSGARSWWRCGETWPEGPSSQQLVEGVLEQGATPRRPWAPPPPWPFWLPSFLPPFLPQLPLDEPGSRLPPSPTLHSTGRRGSPAPPLPTHLPSPGQPMGVGVWLSPGKRIISSVMYIQTGALLLGRTRQGEGARTLAGGAL